jgi:tetratricopeptide (TPR) repeat protein
MVETTAVLVGLLLVGLLVWEMMRERVVIEPLSVPKDLAEAGFTGEVIAQRLLAEIRAIQAGSQTTLQRRAIGYASLDLEMPIAVAGSHISPRALAAYLRNAACGWSSWACRPQLRFSGDVTRWGEGYQIEMRVVGGERLEPPIRSMPVAVAMAELDRLIEHAAISVIWRTDPYILASFIYRLDRSEAERLAWLILQREPERSPAALRAINLLGLIRYDENDAPGAMENYQRAIKLDPSFAVAITNLGLVAYDLGDVEGAIDHYRKALAADPAYVLAHNNLGAALLDKDDLAEAAAACRRAIKLQPDFALAHYNLGRALERQGDLDGAVASYSRAAELGPEEARFRDDLAAARVRKASRIERVATP